MSSMSTAVAICHMWRKLFSLHIFSVPSFSQIGHDVPEGGQAKAIFALLITHMLRDEFPLFFLYSLFLVVVSLGFKKFSPSSCFCYCISFSLFLKSLHSLVAHQKFMAVTCCQVTKIYGYLIKSFTRGEGS